MRQDSNTIKLNLGNGDLVALAGAIVRKAVQLGGVFVPSVANNVINAEALFASVPEVTIFPVRDMAEVLAMDGLAFHVPRIPQNVDRDHYAYLYQMLGLPYSVRWESSPIPNSRLLVPMIRPPTHPYQFVHDDMHRGFGITKRLNPKLVRFPRYPGFGPNGIEQFARPLIAFCEILENAEEIHVMDTASFHYVEHCNPKTDKLFLHRYPRPFTPVWMEYETRHAWTIVE